MRSFRHLAYRSGEGVARYAFAGTENNLSGINT